MQDKYNIIGQRFGRLTVESLSPIKKNRKLYWNCICDCGNRTVVSGSNLRAGKVVSCGCAKKLSRLEYLTGQVFGNLTVLYLDTNNNYARTHWICKCSCGTIKSVAACHLKQGLITNCGCQNIISHGEEKIKELLLQNKINFEQHKKITINNHNYFFDFFVDQKYFIEYDGIQHFKNRTNGGWNTEDNLKETQQRDEIKNNYCFEQSIPLIRIPYTIFSQLTIKDLQLETSQYILLKERAE